MPDPRNIAVIVPFFQRERGIVINAIRSALGQTGGHDIRIIVVDDGSPVRARDELAGIRQEAGERLVIVEQTNKGEAGARNTGLDNLPPATDIVALLDSDDTWMPDHLANAAFAIGKGYDFYFADFYQLGQTVTAFNRARRINVADHPLLPGSQHVHEYRGDMANQIITGNILGVSVTVYDRHKMDGIRFRESFRHTGVEYLFWMDAALRSRKIAFSDEPECRYGTGVNIYSGATWGEEKFLSVIVDEVKYRKQIMADYPLTEAQRKFLAEKIRSLRANFTAGLIHRMKINRGAIDSKVLRRYLNVDKLYPLAVWPAALRLLGEKFRAKPQPNERPLA